MVLSVNLFIEKTWYIPNVSQQLRFELYKGSKL